LVQAERTGKEQRWTRYIHSEDVREQLIKTIGIPAEQVAVKTSEKDELKEVDDIGGLMSRDCKIRYIITKQALQEGWDCAFAYVLVVLTNPASKNALTQLVGRILRQPGARKTKIRELDESYVLCFKQNANKLLASIRDGFGREGLGDLKNQIVRDMEEAGEDGEPPERTIKIRERFRRAANSTILPVFMVRRNKTWEPVNYEMDIAAKIPWDNVDLDPIFSLALSMYEEKDMEHIATLSDDIKKVIEEKEAIQLKEGGIRVDPVFMTRQICDIVPNPWMAHEFARDVLTRLTRKHDYKVVAANFVFIIEELRKQLEREKDRLSENIFKQMLASDQMRFLVIGDKFDFTFPKSIKVKPAAKTLNRKDGRQLQLSLFEFVPEDDFNETEKAVAWYLEGQKRLFFWYRNRSRQDYAIQGWRKHKIYPDFIFTATASEDKDDYEQVYVVETKGLHLIGSLDTDY
nr:restriction endonuclease subunit R [Candidatus Desulfatibia profunda]